MGVPAVSALYFQQAWSHAWHHLACVDHHVLVAIPILKWLRLLGPDYANHSCFIAAMSR
jgi:hypothetical protein